VVVADSSKIGRVGFARICELSRIDEIITDMGVEAPVLRPIEEAGVRVTMV
jgi:DeoR family transcriptional regulator of aga operon